MSVLLGSKHLICYCSSCNSSSSSWHSILKYKQWMIDQMQQKYHNSLQLIIQIGLLQTLVSKLRLRSRVKVVVRGDLSSLGDPTPLSTDIHFWISFFCKDKVPTDFDSSMTELEGSFVGFGTATSIS